MCFGGWGVEQEQEKETVQTGRPKWIFPLVVLLGILTITCLGYYHKANNSNTFAPGVEIAGIPVAGLNQQQAEAKLAHGLDKFRDTKVSFIKDDYLYETTIGELSQANNSRDIIDAIWQQEKARSWEAKALNLTGSKGVPYPVSINYDPAKRDKLLQEWEGKWGKAAQDSALQVDSQNGLVVIPGQIGYKVNIEQIYASLPATMEDTPPLRIPIIVETTQPEVTAEMLQDMGELAGFSTYFNTGEINRTHNLQMAAASINKKILAPNAVFSFNDTVGQRTLEKGYLDAKVIVGNKFEPGLGGGICQVSSTLYNACLLSGLEIVERHNHNLAVAYVGVGRDATVAYGLQDFQFKNNTDKPIYIRAVTSGGRLTINIYGNQQYKQTIGISSIIDKTLDFSTVTEIDNTLAPGMQVVNIGGQLGYVVRSFRTFYGKDGTIIKTEQLATDTYRPLNRLILTGPAQDFVPPEDTSHKDDNGKPGTEQLENTDNDGKDERPLNRPTIQP